MNDIGKRIATAVAVGFFAAAFGVSNPARGATVPESDQPIKLAINEWTGQHITTHIAGEILKRMGYNVEYVTAGATPQFQAVMDGTLHATLEVWLTVVTKYFDHAIGSGNAVDLGELGLNPREGWFYPPYVAEQCPGLPDWTALNGCTELFSSPETFPNGRLLDYPLDWETTNAEKLEGLSLNYTRVHAGGEGALVAEIKSAFAREEPLLVMFWEPHWVFSEYDLKPVTFPAWDAACETDPSWGVNADKTHDCDFENSLVKKMAWVDMKDTWPAAFRFLNAYQVTNADQIPLMKKIDVEGVPVEDAVNEWLDENEARWRAWIEEAMM